MTGRRLHADGLRKGTASLIVAILMVAAASDLSAQQRQLTVSSNADSAMVYVDGNWVGLVSGSPFSIPQGAQSVTVRPPLGGAWSIEPLWFDVSEQTGARTELNAAFDHHYQFVSAPSGAFVFHGQQQLGVTPFLHRTPSPLTEDIRFSLPGYMDVRMKAGDDLWNRVPATLEPLASTAEAVRSDHILEDRGPDWINVSATATAFIAGALAIHYRTKADNRFDDFGVTGKQSLRSDIRRLDVQSGVALGVMQAGLGLVAIRLAF